MRSEVRRARTRVRAERKLHLVFRPHLLGCQFTIKIFAMKISIWKWLDDEAANKKRTNDRKLLRSLSLSLAPSPLFQLCTRGSLNSITLTSTQYKSCLPNRVALARNMCDGISLNSAKLMKKPHCCEYQQSHDKAHMKMKISEIVGLGAQVYFIHRVVSTTVHPHFYINFTIEFWLSVAEFSSFFFNWLPMLKHPLFVHIWDVNVIFWLLNEINLMSLFFVSFTLFASSTASCPVGQYLFWNNKLMSVDVETSSLLSGVGGS